MIKKLLITACILLWGVYHVVGQVERMPFGEQISYRLSNSFKSPSGEIAASKGLIFYDDFEDYDTALDPENWDIKRSTDTTAFDLGSAPAPTWFHCKPSNFSGNGGTYIKSGERSAAISFQAKDATWLITKKPISIEEDDLKLKFWLYYLNNPAQAINTNFYVMLSEAGVDNWESIGKWEEDSPSNQFSEIVSLPIPNKFTGKEIQIAFIYVNNDDSGFQLAIDDIIIGNLTEPDIRIKPYNYTYSTVSISLANTIDYTLNAFISNAGADYTGEGAVANVKIENLSSFSSTYNIANNITNGESKFITFPAKPTFSEIGTYDIEYSVEQSYGDDGSDDGGDGGDGGDDDGKGKLSESNLFSFTISANTLATDYCSTVGVAGGFSAGQSVPFGNKYTINGDIVISGIEILWPEIASSAGFIAQIYEINPKDNSLSLLLEKEYFVDIENLEEPAIYTFDPMYLSAGVEIFVAVKQVGNTPLLVGFDRESNGQFWRLRNGSLELISSPTFGNIAVRLKLEEPTDSPTLSFEVSDGVSALEGVSIEIGENELTTNAEGFASIELENGWYTYTLTKQGLASQSEELLINHANIHRIIVLLPEYKLTINVEDEDEEPIENAEVFITNQSGVTAADGKIEFYLAQGDQSISILADGYNPFAETIELISDSTITIILAQTQTYDVSFAISARHLDKALDNVLVYLTGYGTKYTNADGEVKFSGVLPATNGIVYTISKNGYDQVTRVTEPILNQSILVEDTLDIKTYYVKVEILSGGAAIKDAKVKLGSKELNTDNYGTVLFEDIIPGENISVAISKTGFLPIDTTVSVFNSNLRVTYVLEIEPSSVTNSISKNFSIYPNPSSGEFSIRAQGVFSYEIVDVTGRIINSKSYIQDLTTVNISKYSSGVYFVRLKQNGQTTVSRIVKQ
ncbi:MAG: T9SS type A sorting domain-containing protein [Tenuifilaceae bacterium]|jgi:hypothetical protein|nr:T9SS type A sorting domain-containing protein [Tenuifilaceae bacterium]